ncbi:type I pullulanase [Paenibacillus polysaccharolyticus]|uniref:type I pullulanase n=1 Tax=Paenibacillus polysaccharolyticus TaxID=582692 RepID=UPI00203FFA95|nr:type I pullulanase [Paenibacillus polysaccharolyticus]MCM3133554.1 type I pullulanase [Paenibacillus polysaccharolyticus]
MPEWTSFCYEGNDLGLTYTSAASTFKVWAPTAQLVNILVFEYEGEYNDLGEVTQHEDGQAFEMTRDPDGIWQRTLSGDWAGHFYMYRIVHHDQGVEVVADPYARAVTANGQRTAIIDLNMTHPEGWDQDVKPAFVSPVDAIIYELHVRDFSSDPQAELPYKGKYMAFTATGLTDEAGNSIGVDHLVELGITHVHLLPVADYQTVNELAVENTDRTAKVPYNWGYDPQHYNVPEGSYSTNPREPAVRIREFKAMIQSLHQQGIRVVLDVVYNHTYSVKKGPFERIVPGYFYRHYEDGTLSNGSGVGNELATERPMVRKYILDSLHYWAEEYHIDGFRFDLMALIDLDTMSELTRELKEKIDPAFLIYGEPWMGGDSPLGHQTLKGTQKGRGFAVFNDHFRSAIKGDSDGNSRGFITGAEGLAYEIGKGVAGALDDFTSSPAETVNYVTAHDNLNLWDKIATSLHLRHDLGFPVWKDGQPVEGGSAESAVKASDPYRYVDEADVLHNEMVRRSILASGILLTSQGIPFLHAGDEMLRSKAGDHNSYRSGDAVNSITWANKSRFRPVFDYYRGLIHLRRTHPAFRMIKAEQVRRHLRFIRMDGNVIAYMIEHGANEDSWHRIIIIYNGSEEPQTIHLDEGEWKVVVNHHTAGTDVIETVTGEVQVERWSLMVLYDKELTTQSEPAALEIALPRRVFAPQETALLRATVRDHIGNVLENVPVVWNSSDPDMVRIEKDGTIRTLARGVVSITASVGSITTSCTVQVDIRHAERIEIIGEPVLYTTRVSRFRALVLDQYGQPLTDAHIRWSSAHSDVAAVSHAGIVRALTSGKSMIVAEVGSVRAAYAVTVHRYLSRTVTVCYERADSCYDGWDVWVWGTGMEDGAIRLERAGNVAQARFRVAPGLHHLGFIIRRNEWEAKDTCGDRYVDILPEDGDVQIMVQSGSDEMQIVRENNETDDLNSA